MKAIETVYSGYRFRSRLEARWAVFFDALGVVYQYEPEGYDLDGIWYLPDFWLPEMDCWIEIKGGQPTEEEMEKAKLLAWYTQKDAHIFAGDVWSSVEVSSYSPISVSAEEIPRLSKGIKVRLSLSPELSITLLKINQLGMYASLGPEEGSVSVASHRDPIGMMRPMSLASYLRRARTEIQDLETRIRELPDLVASIEQHKKELFAQVAAIQPLTFPLYLVPYGYVELISMLPSYQWIVCQKCKGAHLCNEFLVHRRCSCPLEVVVDEYGYEGEVCRGDQELLLAAYTMARQARFDGKDAFPWQKETTSGERDSKP